MRIYNIVNIPRGLQEPECDCQEEYFSGYTAGHRDGYEEGEEDQKSKLSFIVITENGDYSRADGYSAITVNVSNSGGSYESGYTDGYADGYDSGVTDGYSSGYTSGKTDGYNSGYTNGYDSGNTDGKEEGFESGFTSGYESGSTEGKEEGYESGYTAGEENQKAKLIATSVTANGVYSREDGYSSITVNVPSGSVINNQSKTYQLTKSNTQITKSVGGDYYLYGGEVITPDSGYTGLAKVTVSCIADITDLYNSGMTEGFDDGYSSGYTAGSEQTYPIAFEEGYESGYTDGYAVGESEGFADGYESGATDAWEPAYNSGYTDGVMSSSGGSYASGYTDGYNNGYTSGNTDGKVEGFNSGYTNGKEEGFDSGYTNGYESGNTDGYASGATAGFNSGYTSGKTDGYNSGYTGGYDSGKTDGYDSGYTGGYDSGKTDGYDSGYTGGYSSGKTDGIVEQKEKLAFTAITENGTYTRNDGWSAVTVNVSGYTQEDLDNAYNSGYTEGYASGFTDGYASGSSIFSKGLTFDILSAGRIYWKASNVSSVKTIEYKVNDGEWTSITSNTGSSAPYIDVAAGDEVFFRGDNAAYATDIANYSSFCGSTCNFNLKGNIMSLIDSTDFEDLDIIESSDAFSKLFYGCTGLINAYKLSLPARTLSDNCYTAMFQGCTNLVTTPELNSTTLAEGCYDLMFAGCTSLTTAPELPATALTRDCYYAMFNGCSRLMRAPELPAPILVEGCYANMFTNCSNLNYIKCLATSISASNCTNGWVTNVASAGTFVKDINMSDWTVGNNGIPVNWVVENYPPVSSSGLVVTYLTNDYGTIDRLFNTVSGFSAAQFEDGTPIALTGNAQSITTDSANTLVKVIYTLSNPVSAGSDDTFWVCDHVVKVEVPEGVTTIPKMFLYMASRLSALTLPNSLQVIKENAFEGFGNMSAITIPSGVTFLGARSLYGAISESAETAGFREIILLPPTPPTLEGPYGFVNPFNLTSNGIIYVPDASVDTYKETPGYTDVAERIKGISERPNN